jgi:hypothetical protein
VRAPARPTAGCCSARRSVAGSSSVAACRRSVRLNVGRSTWKWGFNRLLTFGRAFNTRLEFNRDCRVLKMQRGFEEGPLNPQAGAHRQQRRRARGHRRDRGDGIRLRRPWRDVKQLKKRLASPSELSASPSELLASPSELLATPSELLASPSELSASPSELLASPSQLVASPREL